MKNIKLILLLFFSLLLQVKAQNNKKERLESARIAFISEKIELTPDQARVFWPLYNEYLDKRQEIRKEMRTLKIESNILSASDDELKAGLNKYFSLKETEQALEKEYYTKFSKTITIRQVITLIQAEKQFTLLLLKKLEEGKNDSK